jgi:hypothetical protein
MSAATTSLAEPAGTDLGTHTAAYDDTVEDALALRIRARRVLIERAGSLTEVLS